MRDEVRVIGKDKVGGNPVHIISWKLRI